MKAMLLALALACGSAHAQEDPGMAAQQAAQAAEQANQQAIQSMQAAQQAAQQNMQQAMDASRNAVQNSGPVIAYAIPPTFSVKAGAVTQGTTVRLQSSTNYAAIYFTTNGWMPTTSSPLQGPDYHPLHYAFTGHRRRPQHAQQPGRPGAIQRSR